MNPEKLYDAQLSVSKLIDEKLVDDLISRLELIGESSYNEFTKCIDIKLNRESNYEDNENIKIILKEWLFDLNTEYYSTLSNNIDFLFNITKTDVMSNHIIHLYLY